jgi:hypothetical protein
MLVSAQGRALGLGLACGAFSVLLSIVRLFALCCAFHASSQLLYCYCPLRLRLRLRFRLLAGMRSPDVAIKFSSFCIVQHTPSVCLPQS